LRTAASLSPAVLIPAIGLTSLAVAVGIHQLASDASTTSQNFGEAGALGKVASAIRQWFQEFKPAFDSPGASLQLVGHFGWLPPLLYPFVRGRPQARSLALGVWLPALLAGMVTVYSSANGEENLAIGFFPAFIVAIVFLVWVLEHWAQKLSLAVPVAFLGALMGCGLAVYRDEPIDNLTAVVRTGAFAGIHTTPARREYVSNLQHDLAGLRPNCDILAFDDLPAAYLLSNAVPDTNSSWTGTVLPGRVRPYRRALLWYYRRAGLPQVVVMTLRSTLGNAIATEPAAYSSRDPLLALVRRSYRLETARPEYAIYSRSPRCK
jgi:hypothetical protein